IELQSMKVSVNFLKGFLKNLPHCKAYSLKDVKFDKRTMIEEIWPSLKQMEKLTLHNISNFVYENTVFNLLQHRTEPKRPLKSISFLLKNKGIDPQQIFLFSRRLEEFDRTQMAKIRIMFPSEWKQRKREGGNRDKLYNLLTDNYDEFVRDRVLVSILMIRDDEFHTASNGNLFYGKYPIF
uniref:Uncharacterized protein n=1 Tax=Panagrolaimus sp. ES5 TaxID=591445 RepID=A0AC34FRH7_9BILA